jgi:hypothetical protein
MQEIQMEGDANEAPWERTLRELEKTQIQPPGAPLANRSRRSSRARKVHEKKKNLSLSLSLPPPSPLLRVRSRSLLSLSLCLAFSLTQGARIHLSLSVGHVRAISLSFSFSRSRFLAHTQCTHARPCTNLEEIHEKPCQSVCADLKILVYETLSC